MEDGNVNRAMISNENQEDNLWPCWTMNLSFLIFHIYFYSWIMTKKAKRSSGCKCPCFVLELPMCDQKLFSPHNINILLSSKQVLNMSWTRTNTNHIYMHERRLFVINTKLSKLTKWEMYGRQKNSYGSLVSGRVNTKLTIYYKCILTIWRHLCFCIPFSWISTECELSK